jgi:hypothetical protein
MCFSTGISVKRNLVPLPDALAYGTFHTLRATGQCGTHSEGIFHIVAIVIDIAAIAVHKRRIVIIVAGRAEPPYNPVPVVLSSHVQVKTPFA